MSKGWLRYKTQCPLLTQHGRTLCYLGGLPDGVTRDDVATHLGLGHQSTGRILAELQAEGLVLHRRITIKVTLWNLAKSVTDTMARLVIDKGVGR